jgi:hypothetical protein
MRLHVGEFTAEQFTQPVDGQILCNINTFAPAIIPLAGIAFRVLVGHNTSQSRKNLSRNKILRRNQLYPTLLPAKLIVYGFE